MSIKKDLNEKVKNGYIKSEDLPDVVERFYIGYVNKYENYLEKIILKRYFTVFLNEIYPCIETFLGKFNGPLPQNLYPEKQQINEKIKKAIIDAFKLYSCEIVYNENKATSAVNTVNGLSFSLSQTTLKLLNRTDNFRLERNLHPKYATKHPAIEYNYDLSWWQRYSEVVSELISQIEIQESQDFDDIDNQSLHNFEECALLQRELNQTNQNQKKI